MARVLLRWHHQVNTRRMPWKGERNPYLIWLSEIILQQTRVGQGLPYFLRFKETYPTVQDLAHAPEDAVLRLWQGLGYYSRARNLHATAKTITREHQGKFPSTYNDLIKLKGVGAYTAAAIASFAYGEPRAVVDGNVIRVLSRLFGVDTPFDTAAGKNQFREMAQALIDSQEPAAYNQAIMDFGATVCKPRQPDCTNCPFQSVCFALQHQLQESLPVRQKKPVVRSRYFYYLIDMNKRGLLMKKRPEGDIWAGLYDLPLLETKAPLKKDIFSQVARHFECTEVKRAGSTTQKLTHQTIHFSFFYGTTTKPRKYQRIFGENLLNTPMPKTIALFLRQFSLL